MQADVIALHHPVMPLQRDDIRLQSDDMLLQFDDIALHRVVMPLQLNAIRLQNDDMLLQLNAIRLQGYVVDGDRVAVCYNKSSVEFRQQQIAICPSEQLRTPCPSKLNS